jgi:hypothetical protein
MRNLDLCSPCTQHCAPLYLHLTLPGHLRPVIIVRMPGACHVRGKLATPGVVVIKHSSPIARLGERLVANCPCEVLLISCSRIHVLPTETTGADKSILPVPRWCDECSLWNRSQGDITGDLCRSSMTWSSIGNLAERAHHSIAIWPSDDKDL